DLDLYGDGDIVQTVKIEVDDEFLQRVASLVCCLIQIAKRLLGSVAKFLELLVIDLDLYGLDDIAITVRHLCTPLIEFVELPERASYVLADFHEMKFLGDVDFFFSHAQRRNVFALFLEQDQISFFAGLEEITLFVWVHSRQRYPQQRFSPDCLASLKYLPV